MHSFQQIFAKLVSFQTVSETSNRLLIDYIYEYLKSFQLNPRKIHGDDGRFNLSVLSGCKPMGGSICDDKV